MDVKDVQSVKTQISKGSTAQSKGATQQRALSRLTAEKVDISRAEPVSLNVQERTKPSGAQETRKKANDVINALNLVSDTTQEIDQMVQSLAGIAEQAASGALSESRISVLEQEADNLVREIKQRVETRGPQGENPLGGDPIKLEVEEELGKTLEVILPDTAKDAFGLQDVSLSPAENILRTRASIDSARQRLESLKEAVERSKSEVVEVVNAVDVALQNTEASSASIRDVDAALELSGKLRGSIDSQPDAALNANNFTEASLELLKGTE